ncbi:MAG: hypothetical protein IID05_09705 [Gemmatimonadetes bacterium]|nr:hypothetical protein [Gemmatimonadota bacterium]
MAVNDGSQRLVGGQSPNLLAELAGRVGDRGSNGDIETVTECADECRRGDRLSTGYVSVSDANRARLRTVHTVAEIDVASLLILDWTSPLHDGERDLFAHALGRATPPPWRVCSPDHASVKFGVSAGFGDHLVLLEDAIGAVGGHPTTPLRRHFLTRWLSSERTKARLGTR